MKKRSNKRTKHGTRWSESEDHTVSEFYPDYPEMQRRLVSQSYCAITNRARKLGVVAPRHIWTTHDVTKLRTLYLQGARGQRSPQHFFISRGARSAARPDISASFARGELEVLGSEIEIAWQSDDALSPRSGLRSRRIADTTGIEIPADVLRFDVWDTQRGSRAGNGRISYGGH